MSLRNHDGGARSAAGRNVHIDQAKPAGGGFSGNDDRVGVAYQTDVPQILICIRARERKRTVEIVGRQIQLLLRCSGHDASPDQLDDGS